MSSRFVVQVVVLGALLGCSPVVDLGQAAVAKEVDPPCGVTVATVACPAQPWGASLTFASTDEFQQRLLGQWRFCGGERRYTGRGALTGFYDGAGIEFWREGTALRYAFLRGEFPPLTRATAPGSTGTAQLELVDGEGRARLLADDGIEAAWRPALFGGSPVMQNAAFDVWNFVHLQ